MTYHTIYSRKPKLNSLVSVTINGKFYNCKYIKDKSLGKHFVGTEDNRIFLEKEIDGWGYIKEIKE